MREAEKVGLSCTGGHACADRPRPSNASLDDNCPLSFEANLNSEWRPVSGQVGKVAVEVLFGAVWNRKGRKNRKTQQRMRFTGCESFEAKRGASRALGL